MSVPGAPRPRPLLVTAAAVVGIVVGGLDLLRGLIVGLGVLLAPVEVPARTYPVLLLAPLGALVLVAGILALGRPPRLLLVGAAALVLLDAVDAVTWLATGEPGPPVNDLLGAVLAAVPVFLLLQPAARPRPPWHRAR
jgi:Ca2+/Na+ antiporter